MSRYGNLCMTVCSLTVLCVIHTRVSHSWIKQCQSIFHRTTCAHGLLAHTSRPQGSNTNPHPLHTSSSWTVSVWQHTTGPVQWIGGQLWTEAAVGHTSHAAVTKWTLKPCNTIPKNDLIQSQLVKVKADTISFKSPGSQADGSVYKAWEAKSQGFYPKLLIAQLAGEILCVVCMDVIADTKNKIWNP